MEDEREAKYKQNSELETKADWQRMVAMSLLHCIEKFGLTLAKLKLIII